MSANNDSTWISALTHRYSRVVVELATADPSLVESLTELQFAEALLKRVELNQTHPTGTPQLAILGPTQSGKSTLVNVLLDSAAAAQSALAGFTVHAQGYAQRLEQQDLSLVQAMMAPLQRVPAHTLDANDLQSYVLETTQCADKNLVDNTIVWDTPDFDSISATRYELCVLKIAAFADAILLVVSKDKYADQRVWDMLDLIHAAGKPLAICVNKVDPQDMKVVDNAITARWGTHFGDTPPARVMLPFVKRDASNGKLPLHTDYQHALHSSVSTLLSETRVAQLDEHVQHYIASNERKWLEPVVTESRSRQRWKQLIAQAMDDADQHYVDQYLNNADKYETFNRALAELLTLLEIPGIAPTLTQARKLITWPARKLLGVGRLALNKDFATNEDANGHPLDQERLALRHVFEKTTTNLQTALLESSEDPLWSALARQLRDSLPSITFNFEQASVEAIEAFKPQIDAAAVKLHAQLKTQPALLNMLRAARASADAAGVALAVKSGGLAPTDLILAPAMLSVTTLLTESALGRYLDSIKRDLKRQQREHIREAVLNKGLKQYLQKLADQLDRPELMANRLEPDLARKVDAFNDTL